MESEMDDRVALEVIAGTRATMFLATEIAWRLVDVLVAKNVLSRPEARATLFAIADGVRRDAEGTSSEKPADILARYVEDAGMRFSPPPSGKPV